MNISVEIDYIARDERRQDIPWVRVKKPGGSVIVYQDQEKPLSEEEIRTAEIRRMDCVDCHNRPSHKYNAPDHLIDRAIVTGQVDPALPGIKRAAVEALSGEYETEGAALAAISEKMSGFYKEEHPEVFDSSRAALDRAIAAAQDYYAQNMFPEMKVRWDRYPENIGHFIYPGCMRCHDGEHADDAGKVISRDCTSCHVIMMQGGGERAQMAETLDGLEFVHPRISAKSGGKRNATSATRARSLERSEMKHRLILSLIVTGLLFRPFPALPTADRAACLECHSDKT